MITLRSAIMLLVEEVYKLRVSDHIVLRDDNKGTHGTGIVDTNGRRENREEKTPKTKPRWKDVVGRRIIRKLDHGLSTAELQRRMEPPTRINRQLRRA